MIERPVPFVKMSGSGNDFILVDNRARLIDPETAGPWIKAVCRRALSVGADGVILLQEDPQGEADFAWRFFNNDGGEAEMCGNGGRCAARLAFDLGLAGREMRFRTRVGLIRGWVLEGREVRVQLTAPRDYRPSVKLEFPDRELKVAHVDTGVPHAVLVVDDIEQVAVKELGRAIRYHPVFAPRGANADFVQIHDHHQVSIRTYERGVEDETLACGTGAAATAVALAYAGLIQPPLRLTTRGGDVLTVNFQGAHGEIRDLTLQGPVRYVARGEIDPEAWISANL